MSQRGQITGAVVEGPLAFDIAISIEAARIKGIELLLPERPDILIVPNLEAGNILYKQLVYLAKAECAGIVLGTTVPIILTSRADSGKCRVASCALARPPRAGQGLWHRRARPAPASRPALPGAYLNIAAVGNWCLPVRETSGFVQRQR